MDDLEHHEDRTLTEELNEMHLDDRDSLSIGSRRPRVKRPLAMAKWFELEMSINALYSAYIELQWEKDCLDFQSVQIDTHLREKKESYMRTQKEILCTQNKLQWCKDSIDIMAKEAHRFRNEAANRRRETNGLVPLRFTNLFLDDKEEGMLESLSASQMLNSARSMEKKIENQKRLIESCNVRIIRLTQEGEEIMEVIQGLKCEKVETREKARKTRIHYRDVKEEYEERLRLAKVYRGSNYPDGPLHFSKNFDPKGLFGRSLKSEYNVNGTSKELLIIRLEGASP